VTTAKETLRSEFQDPEARHDYADIFLSSSIALQIKALRLQRGWSQETLAEKAGMKQSRISAMEQASYTGWSLRTLRRLAKAFDLALEVRFESFGTLLNGATSVSRNALERPSFSDDIAFKPREHRTEKAEPDPL
jgi:transcriptional regulator with XRE-family HTH domain